ncbi:MAG: site-2 protease family protein [Methanothrix sp.]
MVKGSKAADKGAYKSRFLAYKKAASVAIAIAVFAFIYYDYHAYYLGLALQVALPIAILVVSGLAIKKLLSLKGGYGMVMLSGEHGIKEIDYLAKRYSRFWELLSMWGMVLGFGLLSYPLIRGRASKKVYAIGIISNMLIMAFVLPFTSYALLFINISRFNLISSAEFSTTLPTFQALIYNFTYPGAYYLDYLLKGIVLVAGFSGYIIALLVANAGTIVEALIKSISINSIAPLRSSTPGVAPVIPGIDLPLFSGILSLAIILIIHEFSHGILARSFKVKLKSVGVLLFGVVPVGAFVEPDETEVLKLDKKKQNKIFSAGVSSNFLAMIIFLIPMLLMLPFVLTNIYGHGVFVYSTTPGYPAYNVIQPGTEILAWDGNAVSNLTQLSTVALRDRPGSLVSVATSTGNYTFVAKSYNGTSRGVIGVNLYEKYFPITNTPLKEIAYFFYSLFGISFMLNFLIAVVNLLPVPGFDGWRIYDNSLKKRYINVLTAVVVIALLLNILPWI